MMNKTIKIIATATAALMMIAGVSACGSDTGGDSDKGRVYYLNLKPEASDKWKALAEEYQKETGIKTTVQTAASGTYEQTLKSEIAKDNAPTLFQVSGNVGLARWKKYTADMSDSEPYKQLRDQSTALKGDNGEILPAAGDRFRKRAALRRIGDNRQTWTAGQGEPARLVADRPCASGQPALSRGAGQTCGGYPEERAFGKDGRTPPDDGAERRPADQRDADDRG